MSASVEFTPKTLQRGLSKDVFLPISSLDETAKVPLWDSTASRVTEALSPLAADEINLV